MKATKLRIYAETEMIKVVAFGSIQALEGNTTLTTENGEHVNQIGKGVYEIALTGKRLYLSDSCPNETYSPGPPPG